MAKHMPLLRAIKMASRIRNGRLLQRHTVLRKFSWTTRVREGADPKKLDIAALLATPSWDPSALLPPQDLSSLPRPTLSELHHLLRLSALPPPSSPGHEKEMLDTLAAQLHFVRQIQAVDTAGVEPLTAIRDESAAAVAEKEVTAETVKEMLESEEVRGKYAPRIRRKVMARESREGTEGKVAGEEDWDVLGTASRKVGRYFVVEKAKG